MSEEARLISYLRQLDRPGLTVADLVEKLERARSDRRWVTKCAVDSWKGGCDWTAGPAQDRAALLDQQERHMDETHPRLPYKALGVCDAALWGE